MRYRELGKTGLKVSEIGLGAEWLERHNEEEVKAVIDCCEDYGINILDCWMSEPNVRTNIGKALKGKREKWIIQGEMDHPGTFRFYLAGWPVCPYQRDGQGKRGIFRPADTAADGLYRSGHDPFCR